ncbi:MAG: hypothetical protein H0Z39_08130 [Peptococcaceae bacterium]|nr:hypothetical protein [Peptococcaceae bacterium]
MEKELKPREIDKEVIQHSPTVKKMVEDFKNLIENKIFNSPGVKRLDSSAKSVIEHLFNTFAEFPEQLPKTTQEKYRKARKLGNGNELLVIADYIAGMTDRYAYKQFKGTHVLKNKFSQV